MHAPLLLSRRFLPLFLAQALGALNDNLFKNALVVLLVFRGIPGAPALVALSGGLFILPYLLFSATAGQLADRFDKARLIRLTKAAEIVLMLAAALALLEGSVPLLLAVLFGLGIQAALFGPLKYGILPDLFADPATLLRANALVEAGTFAAILLGTIAGGTLIGLPEGGLIVAAFGLVLAVAGYAAARTIPSTGPAAPGLRIGRNIARETARLLRAARARSPVWTSLLGLSWFWALGAIFLAQFPVLAQTTFHADNRLVTLLLASFTIGIGLGSLAAGAPAARRLANRALPLLSLCTAGFAALAAAPRAALWTTPAAMLADPAGAAALLCLVGAAASGGLFSVPLYATLQRAADPAERARTIAANNVMNALFMVAAALAIAALAAAGLPPLGILALAAALNLLAAVALRRHAGIAASPVPRQSRL